MTPYQLEQLKANFEAAEGRSPWLYLDTKGNATCGVGHMVRSLEAAQALPFDPPITQTEWKDLTVAPNGMLYTSYRCDTRGRLSDSGIDELLEADIRECEQGLKTYFLHWDEWPDAAQAAVVDMAFNLGVAGLMIHFPHLTAAACAQNWETCSTQCHRLGIAPSRNNSTVAWFRQAAAGGKEAVPPVFEVCRLCGHPKHTVRCEESAPNAQFTCACSGECPHGRHPFYCSLCKEKET